MQLLQREKSPIEQIKSYTNHSIKGFLHFNKSFTGQCLERKLLYLKM